MKKDVYYFIKADSGRLFRLIGESLMICPMDYLKGDIELRTEYGEINVDEDQYCDVFVDDQHRLAFLIYIDDCSGITRKYLFYQDKCFDNQIWAEEIELKWVNYLGEKK